MISQRDCQAHNVQRWDGTGTYRVHTKKSLFGSLKTSYMAYGQRPPPVQQATVTSTN